MGKKLLIVESPAKAKTAGYISLQVGKISHGDGQ